MEKKRIGGLSVLGQVLALSLILLSWNHFSSDKRSPESQNMQSQNPPEVSNIQPTSNTQIRKYDISQQSCSELTGLERADCFIELAIKEKDPKVCKSLEDIEFANRCVRHYATKYDPSACEAYGYADLDALKCWGEVAMEADKSEFCSVLEDEAPFHIQSLCWMEIALYKLTFNDTKEFWMCDKMPEPSFKRYCNIVLSQNASECENLGDIIWESDSFTEKCKQCIEKRPIDCKIFPNPNINKLRFIGDIGDGNG